MSALMKMETKEKENKSTKYMIILKLLLASLLKIIS